MQPLDGPYESGDPIVLERQLALMKIAGIGPLISWWGPEHYAGDPFLNLLVGTPDAGVPATVLYEGQGRLRDSDGGWLDFNDVRNREQFAADLRHLYDRFFSRYPERFFREEGRFVVLAWPSHIYRGPFAAVGRALMAEMPLYLVGTDVLTRPFVRPDASDVVGGFAAESAYGIYLPEIPSELGGVLNENWLNRWQAMVDQWDRWLAIHEPQVKLALPLQFAFDDSVVSRHAHAPLLPGDTGPEELVARASTLMEYSRNRAGRVLPWGTMVSWNEYFEGTSVEPNTVYGTRFLELLREHFGPR
jgi:hypothetical protein